MSQQHGLKRVAAFSRVFCAARSLEDVCRGLVQSPAFIGSLAGAQLHTLTRRGSFVSIAFFGLESHRETDLIGFFDNHPISKSARTKSVVVEPHPSRDDHNLMSLPIRANDAVVATLSTSVRNGEEIPPFTDDELAAVSGLAFLNLSLSGMPETIKSVDPEAGGQLTNRQIGILSHMSKGLTNAQIARKIMLSESSVKLESGKIFKSLGVDNRRDAVKMGMKSGLIQQNPIVESAQQGLLANADQPVVRAIVAPKE